MLINRAPQDARWLHEIKLDGYRLIAYLARTKVVFTIHLVRAALDHLNAERGRQDLSEDRHPRGPVPGRDAQRPQDYFGQTVNIASRVQHLAVWQAILASGTVVADQSRRPAAVAVIAASKRARMATYGLCKVSSAAALGQQSGAMPLLFWNCPSATRVAMPALPSILSL